MKRSFKTIRIIAAMISVSLAVCGASACTSQNNEQNSGNDTSVSAQPSGAASAEEQSVTESTQPSGAASADEQSGAESAQPSGAASADEQSVTESAQPSGAASADGQSVTESALPSETEYSSAESSIAYGTEEMAHPSDLVGKWSLKLETSELTSDEMKSAEERMKNTSIMLNTDGSAVGLYGDARVKGAWGVQNGYVYVILGEATEIFRYYIDTLISVNYQGMSFVK